MSLTAEEWLALPIEEGNRRGNELSPHECFRLRTECSMMPRGPEFYPNGPVKRKKLTQEEIQKKKENEFLVMKEFGMLPNDLTFEEWNNAGTPLNWKG